MISQVVGSRIVSERPRVLALMNDRTAPPARVGQWLADAGVDVDVLDLTSGASVPAGLPEGYSGLLPLGGGMGATDDHVADWLKPERELLAHAAEVGYPVLGLCLGGQLLAAALGGDVHLGDRPELGICDVEVTTEATEDRLFATLPGIAAVPQFHRDGIFAAPPGAVVLATSPDYPVQGFRAGEAAWGVQFHPEIDADIMFDWLRDEADIVRALGADPAEVVTEVREAEHEVERIWRPFAAAFAEVVIEYAARRG